MNLTKATLEDNFPRDTIVQSKTENLCSITHKSYFKHQTPPLPLIFNQIYTIKKRKKKKKKHAIRINHQETSKFHIKQRPINLEIINNTKELK